MKLKELIKILQGADPESEVNVVITRLTAEDVSIAQRKPKKVRGVQVKEQSGSSKTNLVI
jgi:hypothetical protein